MPTIFERLTREWPADRNGAARGGSLAAADPWEKILASLPNDIIHRSGGYERVTSADLLTRILAIPRRQQNAAHSLRLATAMKQVGWLPRRFKIDRRQVRGYIRRISQEHAASDSIAPNGIALGGAAP